jgi:branched-chain amino acid aminotransferase
MAQGTHDFVPDPRNDAILINVNGDLVPRAQASVSVFDSGFMLGDGVWEGLRVHKGRMAFLDQHLDRLWEGAKAIAMDIGISREALEQRLYATIDANEMDGLPYPPDGHARYPLDTLSGSARRHLARDDRHHCRA